MSPLSYWSPELYLFWSSKCFLHNGAMSLCGPLPELVDSFWYFDHLLLNFEQEWRISQHFDTMGEDDYGDFQDGLQKKDETLPLRWARETVDVSWRELIYYFLVSFALRIISNSMIWWYDSFLITSQILHDNVFSLWYLRKLILKAVEIYDSNDYDLKLKKLFPKWLIALSGLQLRGVTCQRGEGVTLRSKKTKIFGQKSL